MPKCNFNKVAKQLYLNHTLAWVYSCIFAVYFQNIFSSEHPWTAACDSYFNVANHENHYITLTS